MMMQLPKSCEIECWKAGNIRNRLLDLIAISLATLGPVRVLSRL